MPLVARHRRDAEQRVAGRAPRREARGVDAGLRHVHPVGRQRVQLLQPAPGPRAGRDDGGGRREDLALAPLGPRHPASGRPAACAPGRPAAAGARAARAPRGRRTRSARRAGPRRRPESSGSRASGRRARRAGSRPGAGHSVLVYRPAERGEPSARPCGRRRCRRSAARGRRFPRARRCGPPSQRPLVARPRDVGLAQRDDEPIELARAVAQGAGPRAVGEPVRDDPGERLGRWCSCPRSPPRRRGCDSRARPPRRAAPRSRGRCRPRCRRRRGWRGGRWRRPRTSRRAGAAPARTPRHAGCGRSSCVRGPSR